MKTGFDEQELEARAYRLLARRPHTRHEMLSRLRTLAGVELAEEIVARLSRAGYLDDVEFAREFVARRRAGRPAGSRLLAAALVRRGVSRETIEIALAGDETADEGQLALEAARARARSLSGLAPAARAGRLYRFLLGRGFTPTVAMGAVREMEREVTESED